ncbi:hypothetical protein ASU31_18630 [Pedobacter ginsenosidimutans]|uniref:Uncharacterized protein n=1 Tax=Pedobacter ginsenosidimutans TaxID=687842 RepID=A0A0T5VLW2_9SPHI|nr:hypothetical protein [Pedobacter ginsenosidimutans]KRT14564.1 hypothetical protein ASU31_18630 [Pedobacter ginsenosidimutans]
MSAYINIYTNSLTDDLIPTILKRLNEHENVLDINSSFSFRNPNGNLPIVFKWDKPSLEIFNENNLKLNFGVSLKSFDLKEYKKKLFKDKIIKQSFVQKIMGLFKKKKRKVAKPVKLSAEVEAQLQNYNKVFSLKYHSGHVFENHFATLICAIITELTNGVCHFTQENVWYDAKNVLRESLVNLYTLEELPNHINKNAVAVAS